MTGSGKTEHQAEPGPRDRAALEAARWLVTLEEAPDDAALRARFDAWVMASPENAAAWADTTDLYDLMAQAPPVHAVHWAPAPATRSGRRFALKAAAAALAAGIIGVAVAPPLLLRVQADHVTATGERRSVTLDDGSLVHLAADSALAVDFEARARRVRLLTGQAFFDVRPDPERPFHVDAQVATIQVLGTAFDVRLGDRGAAVAVRDGQVGVRGLGEGRAGAEPAATAPLHPGDWVRMGWDGGVERGTAPPDEAGSWLDGLMVVRDRPLAEAVDDLRRYYAGLILLTDDSLGARHVSGVYTLDDPVAALTAMAGAQGAVVRRLSPWVLLVSAE